MLCVTTVMVALHADQTAVELVRQLYEMHNITSHLSAGRRVRPERNGCV